jgi:YHS domain-containing protein
LVDLSKRIEFLGRRVQLRSKPLIGTQITICLPIQEDFQPDDVIRDPVCHALIQPHRAYASLEYHGIRYYFCCLVCQEAFQANPETFLLDLGT